MRLNRFPAIKSLLTKALPLPGNQSGKQEQLSRELDLCQQTMYAMRAPFKLIFFSKVDLSLRSFKNCMFLLYNCVQVVIFCLFLRRFSQLKADNGFVPQLVPASRVAPALQQGWLSTNSRVCVFLSVW